MFHIGIVGAGIIGKAHKDAILTHSDCEIASICDVVIEKAQALAEGTKASVYADYKEMQKKERLDAVILNLPHFLHKEVSLFFLEKGIPVLLEKPMAITTEECDAMIAAAKKHNTYFAVGHVQRYSECHKRLKELVGTEELGKLCQMIEIRNVNYFTEQRPRWFLDKKLSGGGMVMNYGAHTLDKFLYITGLKVESITAKGNNFLTGDNVEASAQMLLGLSGGVTALCSYCGSKVCQQYETYFYFTKGVVKVVNGLQMWISREGEAYEEVKLIQEKLISEQLVEFVKLLKGKKSEIATPEYSREIIFVLEEALRQIG